MKLLRFQLDLVATKTFIRWKVKWVIQQWKKKFMNQAEVQVIRDNRFQNDSLGTKNRSEMRVDSKNRRFMELKLFPIDRMKKK